MSDFLAPPVLDVDPYSYDVISDPYPFFEKLRDVGPVAYIPKYRAYAVGWHDECRVVLSDYTRFSGDSGVGIADARIAGVKARPRSALLEIDPPERGDVRQVAQRIMGVGVTKKWKADFDTEANRLVQSLLDRDIDGVEDLAEHFVHRVFFQSMGLRFDRAAI